MGTKNNPGSYDCYANAEPDEPMFVLLGRDPTAWLVVSVWARLRERMGKDPAQIEEARECAAKMHKWAVLKGKKLETGTAMVEFQAAVAALVEDSEDMGLFK